MSDWISRISFTGQAPKHVVLAGSIIEAINNGLLQEGSQLPTHRALADALGLSVQTVSISYQELQRRGLIHSVVGRGSFVSAKSPAQAGSFLLNPGTGDDVDLSVVQATYTSEHEQAARQVMAAMADSDNSTWMNQARPVAGLEPHRQAAASFLHTLGVDTTADRLIITNGATQGLFLAMAAVARPGDLVLTENMTENGIIGAANVLGLSLRGLDTDEEGILPEAFEAACMRSNVAALVWVPSFGNPTNHLAGKIRRERIAAVAAKYKVVVIEDEVYKPLLDKPLPAITELLPDLGFFATSLTKSVMSGLRVGYLVAPKPFTLRIASILRSTSWSTPPAVAEIAGRWLNDGTAERLIQLQRKEARERHAILQETLSGHIIRSHPLSPSAWLRVPEGWTEAQLVTVLRERRIMVTPSAPFFVGPEGAQAGIRVCLAGRVSQDALRSALGTIKETFLQLPSLEAAGYLL
jgi:DNA-binding transcriptional MocR family regulator